VSDSVHVEVKFTNKTCIDIDRIKETQPPIFLKNLEDKLERRNHDV